MLSVRIDGNSMVANRKLLNAIASIRSAELRALRTDEPALLPGDAAEQFWREVWLTSARQRLVQLCLSACIDAGHRRSDPSGNAPFKRSADAPTPP